MSTGTTSTVRPIKRPATDQVWAWRHNFYDFRKAKRLVERGAPDRAREYLNGPHAQYVRARFRAIGSVDHRFLDAIVMATQDVAALPETAPASNQPVIASPPQVIPPTNQVADLPKADQPTPVLHVAPDIAEAFGLTGMPNVVIDQPLTEPAGGVIVRVKDMRDALRALRRSIPVMGRIEKGMRDSTGREVKAMVGAQRVRFESVGESLRLSALDYPDVPAIVLDRVHIDARALWAIDVELLCQIFELSIDDTMSIRVEGSELHVRGGDSHYKLFHEPPADAYRFALPAAKLTPSQWLARALELAGTVTKQDTDAQQALESHLKPATPAARRKFAWSIVKAKPADAKAYPARVALIDTLGVERVQKWLSTVIGSAVTFN